MNKLFVFFLNGTCVLNNIMLNINTKVFITIGQYHISVCDLEITHNYDACKEDATVGPPIGCLCKTVLS